LFEYAQIVLSLRYMSEELDYKDSGTELLRLCR